MEARYANYVEVGTGECEFVFVFGQWYGGDGEKALHTHIVTSPACARELRRLLDESIARYEGAFGPLPES